MTPVGRGILFRRAARLPDRVQRVRAEIQAPFLRRFVMARVLDAMSRPAAADSPSESRLAAGARKRTGWGLNKKNWVRAPAGSRVRGVN
jgi:hypothetical protein